MPIMDGLEAARNQGIGSTLLEAAAEWAACHGIGYLSAGIYHRNADAMRFYSRHGVHRRRPIAG